jgi:hypothetical protein
MDPNAALAAIREAITSLQEPTDDTEDAWNQVDELVDHVVALDEWLTKGGFLPDAWASAIPTDRTTER